MESSGIFVYLGDLFKFSVPRGHKKLLCISIQAGTMSLIDFESYIFV